MSIKIEATPKAVLDVELVGVHYSVTPPKAALALRLAVAAKQSGEDDPGSVVDTLNAWLLMAMGEEQEKAIQARIEDPKDALDIDHLMMLMEAVIEESSGNPTGSSPATRRQRSATGKSSTAGPRLVE